mmetsp:Transcript_4229/g.8601  ORF Transcript_4229/g.8601 Transcript_4229/m.8601 type:complete len:84 (-) Transcript_4229:70-321(-)
MLDGSFFFLFFYSFFLSQPGEFSTFSFVTFNPIRRAVFLAGKTDRRFMKKEMDGAGRKEETKTFLVLRVWKWTVQGGVLARVC